MKSQWFYISYTINTSKLLMLHNNLCYVLMNTAGKTKTNKQKPISSKQKSKNGQSKTVLQTLAWRFLGLSGKLTSFLAECLDSMNSIVFVCWSWWGHNITFVFCINISWVFLFLTELKQILYVRRHFQLNVYFLQTEWQVPAFKEQVL